jgi:hypothetical protein
MKSRTTRRFRDAYEALPSEIRRSADRAYQFFEQDPRHPSLRFKKVHPTEPVYSVRITREYRALGLLEGDTVIWFWIGSHADYEQLLD